MPLSSMCEGQWIEEVGLGCSLVGLSSGLLVRDRDSLYEAVGRQGRVSSRSQIWWLA